MKTVNLYGANRNTLVIIKIRTAQRMEVAGLVDDNPQLHELFVNNVYQEMSTNESQIVNIERTIRKIVVGKLTNYNFFGL